MAPVHPDAAHPDAAHPDAAHPDAPRAADRSLEQATLDALDDLLRALRLEPLGDDRFRAEGEPGRFERVFGGQLVAQALLAAGATVTAKQPHSLHAYFVGPGVPGRPVEVTVDRVRDGRTISARQMTVAQDGRPLLTALASFHDGPDLDGPTDQPPRQPGPDTLPRLQDGVSDFSSERRAFGQIWIEQPPPVELRIAEPPSFMGGPRSEGPRLHWMRLPRQVGDDPLLLTALLAYVSDYLMLDMIPRAHPDQALGSTVGASLDHSLWFHRPVRPDRWHRYTQTTQALSGHRGLVRGTIHDTEDRLVASVMQEGLFRPAP
jgi:acyl-CoA thioesterase-2